MGETITPFWHGLAAGGSSAVVSRLFTYPPDTVKARLQVQGSNGIGGKPYLGTVDAFVKIAKSEGVPGFYRGFGAILLSVIPANMCYFSGYEMGKRITPQNWGTGSDLMTATIAQTVAGVAFCPIDIVKQRVQTASVMGPAKMTPMQAAGEVWHHQGLRGFFRGYWAMNALWYPWNCIYLTMYEEAKRRVYYWELERRGLATGSAIDASKKAGCIQIHRDLPLQQVLPVWAFPLCSSSCAAVAAIVTHPIDVVKTRLQVLAASEHGKKRSIRQVATELYTVEGYRGFSRGMMARVATLSMGSSISWFVYEMVKRKLASSYYKAAT